MTNSEKIIVGHQPQYFPYLGILDKISKSDIFLFVDSTKFVKKIWHNRTIIKDNKDNVFYLTIPTINNGYQKIKDVKISDKNWKKKHLKTLRLNYKKMEHFDEIYEDIEKVILQKSNFLMDYTAESMKLILKNIEYNKNNIYTQSDLGISGEKNNLIINIVNHFGSKKYLSGEGGKNYVDEKLLKQSGIDHKFNNFLHPIYKQHGLKFVPNLSSIDSMFSLGYNGFKKLFKKTTKKT